MCPLLLRIAACLMALGATPSLTRATPPDARAFGATGDGLADDTDAIQRAVSSGSGVVRFPKGHFRLTRTVLIDMDQTGFVSLAGDGVARIVMAGPGPAFKFVGTHGGTAGPDTFKTNVWERQRAPMADGIEIVGGHPEADGIGVTGTMQLTITRTILRDLRHGIHLTTRNRNVLIADCHIYNNRGIGIFFDDVSLHQSNVSACHISYCAGGGVVSRGGDVRNLHIGTCDIESNMATNAPPTANILLDSSGGSIGEVAITGCTIQHNSASPDSANIRILGHGKAGGLSKRIGSDHTHEGHVTITGNVLSDVQVNLHIHGARGVTITGNTFWMGYQRDLLVEDSSNIVTGPNNFDRNPRYSYGSSQEVNGGIVFRDSRDCTLDGLHINGVWRQRAALLLEKCDRFNVANCTILDCDNVGLALQDANHTRVSGCLIRDDRPGRQPAPSIELIGGRGNWVSNNLLANGHTIAEGSARAEGNWDGR